LDGAQTPGQVMLDLTKMGADFYAFNGHKWMLAPLGCAGLYVRPEAQDRLSLVFTGDGAGWTTTYPDGVESHRRADGTRFEYGTRNWAALAAWREVMEFWAGLGVEAAYRRQRELAAVLTARLREVPGLTLWSPDLPVGGIVSFTLAGYNATTLSDGLRARKVIGRGVGRGIQGVRLCTTFFNNLDDVGQAVDAVRELAQTPPPSAP
jgi:L-cysteine/cystine lyase